MTTEERIEGIRALSEEVFGLMEKVSALYWDLEEYHLKAYQSKVDTASSILNCLQENLTAKANDLEKKLSR